MSVFLEKNNNNNATTPATYTQLHKPGILFLEGTNFDN